MRTTIATRLALGIVLATAAFATGSAEAKVTSNGVSINGLSFQGTSFNGVGLNGRKLLGGGDAVALRVKAVRLPDGRVLVGR